MKPRTQDYQQAARSVPDPALPVLHQRAREAQDFNAVTAELPPRLGSTHFAEWLRQSIARGELRKAA